MSFTPIWYRAQNAVVFTTKLRLATRRLMSIRGIKTRNGPKDVHLNTAPIEFTPNIMRNSPKESAIAESARKALSCTTDVSEKSSHIPFEVKSIDPKLRKAKRESLDRSHESSVNLKKLIDPYIQLSKPRLTMLVMLSAICSYAISPNAASVSQLLSLTVGTTLCSASANAINMGREPDFDRQMIRTQARPVVRGLVTPSQAYKFAALCGTVGSAVLWTGVNSAVALLGASNIVLYAWIYTSLKRRHIINTWAGALVGAIPPLMGWAAASPLTDPGAWCIAGLLYAWQFPHFNTLSHNIRNEYRNAGYVMTAWKNPLLNARVALRYSLLMFPICFGFSYFGVTDWMYQIDSGIINAWMSFWAFKFYWQQKKNYYTRDFGDKAKYNKGLTIANGFAKKTFLVSVLHLPAVLILAILHKKGRWNWLFEDEGKEETLES
ncbi:probable Protoheme IX farnesyltransferase, mitochondrial [Zygosaccharomyces bailii]|nr:probable Protoheme IX farnesyltransferase, mitochondrial [Zygosaccharomyces bailii]